MARKHEQEIRIKASLDDLWDAITSEKGLTQWCVNEAKVTPGVGGTQWISWGKGMEVEKQHLVWEPGSRLLLGTPGFETASGWDAVTVEFRIEKDGDEARIRVIQAGLADEEDWDGIYESTEAGWRLFLMNLKFYLENHRGRLRRTIDCFGNVQGNKQTIWNRLVGPERLGIKNPDSLVKGQTYQGNAFGQPVSGTVLLCDPHRNFTVTVTEYEDSLLAFDLAGNGPCFMNFILSTYGVTTERYEQIKEPWTASLAELVE